MRKVVPWVVAGVVLALALLIVPTVGFILAGVAIIALPAWFNMPVSRVVGALFIGGVLFLFLRHVPLPPALHELVEDDLEDLPALLVCVAAALLAWAFVPVSVLRRFTFLVPSMVTLIYVVTLLMYAAPGSPFAEERQASNEVIAAKRATWGVPEDRPRSSRST